MRRFLRKGNAMDPDEINVNDTYIETDTVTVDFVDETPINEPANDN